MKVRKIDISEQEVDLPNTGERFWDFAFIEQPFDVRPWADQRSVYRDEEEGTTMEGRIYELREVERERFLVPIDQMGIFTQLIEVSEEDLLKVIRARTQHLEAQVADLTSKYTQAKTELDTVKKLPWWKKMALK